MNDRPTYLPDATPVREHVARVYGGRPWIVAHEVAVGACRTAERLLDLGASAALAIGTSRGTGDLSERVPHAHLTLSGASIMEGIRAAERALATDPTLRAAADAFDPEHKAGVVGALFSTLPELVGRPVFGGRPPAWIALEDKTVVDALWDAIGVPRAPAEVVAATLPALQAAAHRLDLGEGTVWAGDSREGFHGAAEYVRWIRTNPDAIEAAAFFAAHCDRVRVMPFLEGIPCSIHGIVLPETVLALRPCEMVVFRTPGSARFTYARAATFWDPAPADAEVMRDLARKVGAHLRDTVDYRGVFTVDGIMTRGGFRPTELNPRYGAALAVLTNALPELDTYLLHLSIVAGHELPFAPEALEELILRVSATERRGGAARVFKGEVKELRKFALVREPRWHLAEEGEIVDATGMIGPSSSGGYVGIDLVPARTPIGPASAPDLVGALACVEEAFGLGLGVLEAARGVR
jgi:hypothetical protein